MRQAVLPTDWSSRPALEARTTNMYLLIHAEEKTRREEKTEEGYNQVTTALAEACWGRCVTTRDTEESLCCPWLVCT